MKNRVVQYLLKSGLIITGIRFSLQRYLYSFCTKDFLTLSSIGRNMSPSVNRSKISAVKTGKVGNLFPDEKAGTVYEPFLCYIHFLFVIAAFMPQRFAFFILCRKGEIESSSKNILFIKETLGTSIVSTSVLLFSSLEKRFYS